MPWGIFVKSCLTKSPFNGLFLKICSKQTDFEIDITETNGPHAKNRKQKGELQFNYNNTSLSLKNSDKFNKS